MADVMKAGYCPSGARRWFESYGLQSEFRALVKGQTISSDALLDTGDAAGLRVVAAKIQREWLDGDPSSLILTAAELKEDKRCMAGAREFASRHGINWQGFVDNGISAKRLIEIGDHEAIRVLRRMMERRRG